VTSVAGDCCFVVFVAVNAPLHLHHLLGLYDLLKQHVAVAAFALCFRVFAMAEENEVGNLIDAPGWNVPFGHAHVTHLALLHRGEAGKVRAHGTRVAGHTLQLQWSVLLVIEGSRLVSSVHGYGKEKATKESE
jgi:hypothetical protein